MWRDFPIVPCRATSHDALCYSKDVDTKYPFNCEAVERKQVNIVYCPVNTMTADILSKRLAKQRLQE